MVFLIGNCGELETKGANVIERDSPRFCRGCKSYRISIQHVKHATTLAYVVIVDKFFRYSFSTSHVDRLMEKKKPPIRFRRLFLVFFLKYYKSYQKKMYFQTIQWKLIKDESLAGTRLCRIPSRYYLERSYLLRSHYTISLNYFQVAASLKLMLYEVFFCI